MIMSCQARRAGIYISPFQLQDQPKEARWPLTMLLHSPSPYRATTLEVDASAADAAADCSACRTLPYSKLPCVKRLRLLLQQ